MSSEARLVEKHGGLIPEGAGWFVVNARDSRWWGNEKFGLVTSFEGDNDGAGFKEFGINIRVLEPGQPNCLYHGETGQEDFLVLFGECLLLVEGEERPLKQWDFVHCPPMTQHVFVGTGRRGRGQAQGRSRTGDDVRRRGVRGHSRLGRRALSGRSLSELRRLTRAVRVLQRKAMCDHGSVRTMSSAGLR
jgi:mannose-6-phosphate isomerase-like protein (cupin superfamily)